MDPNKNPTGAFLPGGRKTARGPKKDRLDHYNNPSLQKQETQERRNSKRLQTLNDKNIAEDVTKKDTPLEFGQYKWKDGKWFAITQEDPEWWLSGCQVRDVPSRSLNEVRRRGGWVTPKDLANITAGAAKEDANAPVLQPRPDPPDAMLAEDESDVQEAPTAAKKTKRTKRKTPDSEDEWSSSRRAERKAQAQSGYVSDGSEIIVTHRSRTPPPPSKDRSGQPMAFPRGL